MTIDYLRESLKSTYNDGTSSYLPLMIKAYESGINIVTHGAPCIIFASVPASYVNGMVDLSISLSYLELAAVSVGLGTCWLGLIKRALHDNEPLKELVGLPEDHSHFYPIILGYPKFKYHRLPERNPARIFWK